MTDRREQPEPAVEALVHPGHRQQGRKNLAELPSSRRALRDPAARPVRPGRFTTGATPSFTNFQTTGSPRGIAPGPDGNLWFTQPEFDRSRRNTELAMRISVRSLTEGLRK